MSWSFVRREWGAVTFVLTVVLGAIIVPLTFLLGNHGAPAGAAGSIGGLTATPTPTVAASASPAAAASPSPTSAASPTATPAPSATP